jgi:hypothetical protein
LWNCSHSEKPGLKVDKWSSTMAPLALRDHPVNRRRLKLHCEVRERAAATTPVAVGVSVVRRGLASAKGGVQARLGARHKIASAAARPGNAVRRRRFRFGLLRPELDLLRGLDAAGAIERVIAVIYLSGRSIKNTAARKTSGARTGELGSSRKVRPHPGKLDRSEATGPEAALHVTPTVVEFELRSIHGGQSVDPSVT